MEKQMSETTKLYQVELKGMTYSATGSPYGIAYVLATNPTEAYLKLRKLVDDCDVGFRYERELESITLIAESAEPPGCRMRLII